MIILLLLLTLPFELPSSSYEAGHYFMPQAVAQCSYELSKLVLCRKTDDHNTIIEKKGLALMIGFAMGGLSQFTIFKSHYQVKNEREWGGTGLLHWTIFRFCLMEID